MKIPLNIQVDDEDHYSPYPTVADDISVALPLMDDESPKEERNGKKQTGPADYRYLPRNDPPGLNQGTAGNVSVRYQGGMLITPTGIPYEKLTEDKIVFIDADGQHEQENCPPANGVFIRRPTRRDPMPVRWSTITLSIVRRCRSSTGPSRPFTI